MAETPSLPFPLTSVQEASQEALAQYRNRGLPRLCTEWNERGEPTRRWIFEGMECRRVELATGLAKQFAGFKLIHEDLKDVKAWLELAHRLLDAAGYGPPAPGEKVLSEIPRELGVQLKALMFAAITCYGKCFASSEGRGVKLEERDHVPPRLVSKHRDVLEYRNQLTAHAGRHSDVHAEHAQAVIVHPPVGHQGLPVARVEMTRLEFMDDRADPVPMVTLVDGVVENVRAKLALLTEKLELQARSS